MIIFSITCFSNCARLAIKYSVFSASFPFSNVMQRASAASESSQCRYSHDNIMSIGLNEGVRVSGDAYARTLTHTLPILR